MKSTNANTKRDVYTIVTERIIETLEQGTVPWKQPWQDAGQPQNLITKRPYRGINVMLLASLGYSTNCFLTFNQLKELGGSVKKDEKANIVVYWNWLEAKDAEEKADKKKVPYLRYYNVFNVAQCDGIPDTLIPRLRPISNPIPECETLVNGMPDKPVIQHLEPHAYYSPPQDVVNMPARELFGSDESYYGTLFHELVHSTGHPKRLNRKGFTEMSAYGSEPYSFEELVAEIGACYLESFTGIAQGNFDCNVAYLKGWLKKLKSDKRFIVQASAQAQKATDFILKVGDSDSAPFKPVGHRLTEVDIPDSADVRIAALIHSGQSAFTTEDDRIFTGYSEALGHCKTAGYDHLLIREWVMTQDGIKGFKYASPDLNN